MLQIAPQEEGGPVARMLPLPYSPAWEAGLRRGMFIGQVDGTPVRTPKQFHAQTARHVGPVRLGMADDDETPLRTVQPES